MTSASPEHATPVQSHRFYLYHLKGLDLHKDSDKAKCREYLFGIGYGNDPKAVAPRETYTQPRQTRTTNRRHARREKYGYDRF